METLKSVCSYLSREIGANQLEHMLLRVPIQLKRKQLTFSYKVLPDLGMPAYFHHEDWQQKEANALPYFSWDYDLNNAI